MWQVAEIYRHPVKSLGEEALDEITLETGKPMAHDRTWAIAHGSSEWDPDAPAWIGGGANLVNQTYVPKLAQIETSFKEGTGTLTLRHPEAGFLSVQPGTPDGNTRLTEWIAPLTEGTPRSGPFVVCQAKNVAFTDFEDTHISIASCRSRAILEDITGTTLDAIRFRMNIWLDGMAPWEEFDLVGRELDIGSARLKVIRRCERCNATTANPETGLRDVQIPSLLRQRYGHMDFGVYAQVIGGGPVRIGDGASVV
jgi:uncharacterized protein YcbX